MENQLQLNSQLHEAISLRDIESVTEYINRGANVNANVNHPTFGIPLLHTCIQHENSLETIKLLLQHGADVHGRDGSGRTVLHEACTMGRLDVVRYLVKKYESQDLVNARDHKGCTPLCTAMCWYRRNLFRPLLAAGANILDACNEGGNHDLVRTRDLVEACYNGITEQIISCSWQERIIVHVSIPNTNNHQTLYSYIFKERKIYPAMIALIQKGIDERYDESDGLDNNGEADMSTSRTMELHWHVVVVKSFLQTAQVDMQMPKETSENKSKRKRHLKEGGNW